MRAVVSLVLALLAVAFGLSSRAASPDATPVVVELFTSEGCSDCPPADAVLEKLIGTRAVAGADVIGLGQHVDYWDQLGWKDRFSSAALTNRQHIYGAHFRLESVYTPQIVVDGQAQLVGSDGRAAVKAIERAAATPHAGVQLDLERRGEAAVGVTVHLRDVPAEGHGDRHDVIVAVTEDHLRSDVTRGENHGRTLTHAAVVRSMTTIGQAGTGESTLRADLPIGDDWKRGELKVVAFVQEQRGRAILGAASMALQAISR